MTWLQELRALVPRALINGPGWDRLQELIAELPAMPVASRCGFEFRLGTARPTADLFVAVAPGQKLADHYVRQGEAAAAGSPAAALGRHLVELGHAESAPVWITGTMLEYDVAETAAGQQAAPGVFLKLRLPHSADRAISVAPSVLIATLARAVGWTEHEGEQRAVARVLAALPPGGEVAHAGALPGRAPRAVRLIVQGIEHGEVPDVLERLEWDGSICTAAVILADLRELLPRFRLAVDVGAGGVSPRLGLELYPAGEWRGRAPDSWLMTGRGDWRPVVEWLTDRGWCLPAKCQGLLEWCALDKVFDRQDVHLLYKGINHVKLTVEGSAVQAKAYAGMTLGRGLRCRGQVSA